MVPRSAAAILLANADTAVLARFPGPMCMNGRHATFPTGGFDFEAGITDMENRFAEKRLLIARHLQPVFDEYQGYHRVNGLVNKVDDDLLSAIRVLCMDIRTAKTVGNFPGIEAVRFDPGQRFARGSLNHPGGDIDVFAGT